MRIVFDPDFDSGSWPGPLGTRDASVGEAWLGPGGLLGTLETAMGLGAPTLSESERTARLMEPMRVTPGFWSASASVDPFGSARRLLAWCDTLAMAGWSGGGVSPRLAQMAALRAQAPPGFPDRIAALHAPLARGESGIESITVLTPLEDLEPLWRTTLGLLAGGGVRVVVGLPPIAPAAGDLGAARAAGFAPRGDGSLRLLRPQGELAAADEVAAWLAAQPAAGATVVVGGDAVLDAALRRYGLPTLGAEPAYADSATLQVLVLALELLWSPQDPQRALELLSLPASPVPRALRYRLIAALNQWPAVGSPAWVSALSAGLDELEPDRRAAMRERMDELWAARASHGADCPVDAVVRRTTLLRTWLQGNLAHAEADAAAWRAGATQCDALLDLLERARLDAIPAPQLRRLVDEATRAASLPSAWPAEAGLRAVGAPGGVAGPVPRVVWWNFNAAAVPAVTRLPLSAAERAELAAHGCELPDPGRTAAALARRWRRPLEQATGALLLVCPERDPVGSERFPHPLWDELLARTGAMASRRRAEAVLRIAALAGDVPSAPRVTYPLQPLPVARHTWSVPPGSIPRRAKESPSSAESLLGCSFKWALEYAGGLYPPDALSLPGPNDTRLLGSLFHHLLEQLLARPALTPEQAALEAGVIFDREGPMLAAPIFLPGAEASRAAVRRVAAAAARELFRLLAAANVRVLTLEQTYTGMALDGAFAGRPDIVLGDPVRIVDMKWGGASWRRRQLANGAATQLAAYSHLLRAGDTAPFPPVAYFILSEQRVLTTAPGAFPGAEPVPGPDPGATWALFESAHAERRQQLDEGVLQAGGLPDPAGNEPPKETAVVQDRLVVQPPCTFCDLGALCGRDLVGGA